MYELGVERTFSAAHQLRGYKGKCESLHGHTYKVEVVVTATELNDIGLAIDFKDLKRIIDDMLETYDHHLINEIPPFDKINPSAENIARVFYETISEQLPDHAGLKAVKVWESENSWATYSE